MAKAKPLSGRIKREGDAGLCLNIEQRSTSFAIEHCQRPKAACGEEGEARGHESQRGAEVSRKFPLTQFILPQKQSTFKHDRLAIVKSQIVTSL